RFAFRLVVPGANQLARHAGQLARGHPRRRFMRYRNLAGFGAALLIGAICGSLIGPRPAAAVAREIIELQRDVTSLLQGQKDIATQVTQDHTVMRTLIEQSNDTVGKLNGTMSGLQKSVQDVQANSG